MSASFIAACAIRAADAARVRTPPAINRQTVFRELNYDIVRHLFLADVLNAFCVSRSFKVAAESRLAHFCELAQPMRRPPFNLTCDQMISLKELECVDIGDEDVRSLCSALAIGAFANLQILDLSGPLFSCGKIGDTGITALAAACAKGALAILTELTLFHNKIGDKGLSSLADSGTKGGLASLEKLNLEHNDVGDAGFSSLAQACAKGGLANLTYVELLENPGDSEPVRKVLRERELRKGEAHAPPWVNAWSPCAKY